MLNIDKMQERQPLPGSLIELLEHARFIVESVEHIGSFELTSDGFHFVLLDMPTQVHMILRKYIEYMLSTAGDCQELKIELIKLILNLALSEWNQVYKLRVTTPQMQRVKDDFEAMGLFDYIDDQRDKFYITRLL